VDPEIGNRGKVWGEVWGGSPLHRKFLKVLSKNTAFLCKIFACFEIHQSGGGGGDSPPTRL